MGSECFSLQLTRLVDVCKWEKHSDPIYDGW